MSLETRKQHRHDARPSRIDPSLSRDGCTRALAVRSHLPRTATPTESPICAENPARRARREDGVERHRAIRGHQPALLWRTPGNSRAPEAMAISRVGRSAGKPVFWLSGAHLGLQTAARTVERDGEGAPWRHQTRGRNAKSRSVKLRGIPQSRAISRHPSASPTPARTQWRRLRRTSRLPPQWAPVGHSAVPPLLAP